MKVTEIKSELEKAAKFIPELRKDLDEAYHLDAGKKSKIKLLWKEYADRYNDIKDTKEYRNLQ